MQTDEYLPRKVYYRAKQLVSILKMKQEEIYKEFTLRHRKRFYTFQDGVFYEFSSSKEIIIDENAILKSKNRRHIDLLLKSRQETRRDYISLQKHEKTPVIVILGHFNHGKTTLLDSLGGFSIVEKEAHGITQVSREEEMWGRKYHHLRPFSFRNYFIFFHFILFCFTAHISDSAELNRVQSNTIA